MSPRRLSQLATLPVDRLTGVGPKKVAALADMEIETVLDLVTHYPRRYLDRTQQARIADLKVGDEAMVLAVVKRSSVRRTFDRLTTASTMASSPTFRSAMRACWVRSR